MVENLIAEAIGVLVTVLLVDTLYAYHAAWQEHRAAVPFMESVEHVLEEATVAASGPGARHLLALARPESPDDVLDFADAIDEVTSRIGQIEHLISVYAHICPAPIASAFASWLRNVHGTIALIRTQLRTSVERSDELRRQLRVESWRRLDIQGAPLALKLIEGDHEIKLGELLRSLANGSQGLREQIKLWLANQPSFLRTLELRMGMVRQ